MKPTTTRVRRYDFACSLALDGRAPTPATASATRTPEGYLQVDGYLARSGLLEYSDGVETWTEYRPKQELHDAARSWLRTPITDEHPDDMVNASNWTQLAKGHLMQSIEIETLADGEDYIRAGMLITDKALVDKITSATGPRELSIGFSAAIVPTPSGHADDGTRCDAVQLQLDGNHVAVVAQGRAGPSARLLMDGAAYNRNMRPRNDKMQTVHSPSGEPVHVPAWVAAMVNQAQAQLAAPADAQQQAAPAAPRMVTVKVGDQTAEVPEWLADQLRTIASSPGGQAIIDQVMAGRQIEQDSLESTARFMKRQGYDSNTRVAPHLLLDPVRARILGLDAPRSGDRTDSAEAESRTARFMKRQGY